MTVSPAAFRRLCVETRGDQGTSKANAQPPLGGCVLKHADTPELALDRIQPPLGGCVLKQNRCRLYHRKWNQPPLGGCVLKLLSHVQSQIGGIPAAFRRLCVETILTKPKRPKQQPAAFRRLCVETSLLTQSRSFNHPQPPLGGCVLKQYDGESVVGVYSPAAFRRLCVETD